MSFPDKNGTQHPHSFFALDADKIYKRNRFLCFAIQNIIIFVTNLENQFTIFAFHLACLQRKKCLWNRHEYIFFESNEYRLECIF